MVVVWPPSRVTQGRSARAGSSAKALRRRLHLLYLHGAGRLDPGRPLILLWICNSLGSLSTGKLDPSSSAAEFYQCCYSSPTGLHLQVDVWPVGESLLCFWAHLRARSVAAGVGTICYDGDHQPVFLRGGTTFLLPLLQTPKSSAFGHRTRPLATSDRFPHELPSRGPGQCGSPASNRILSTLVDSMAPSRQRPG